MSKHSHNDDAHYKDCLGCNPGKLVYLGDGLYAEFDGYQILLKANDPEHPTDTVALEPNVLASFQTYIQQLHEALS